MNPRRYTSEMTREEFDREVMQTRDVAVCCADPAECELLGRCLLEPASDELWHGVPRRPASCGEAIYDAGPYDEMARLEER